MLTPADAPPVAIYILPDNAEHSYRDALDQIIVESGMVSWIWDISALPMPDLPF